MVVQESHINGVTIRFHDDFIMDINDEKISRILERIAARAREDLSAAAIRSESDPDGCSE